MKKLFAMILATLMLLSCCATAEVNFDTVPTDISGEVTFYMYYADSAVTVIDAAVAKMAEKYPNLKINIEHRADSDDSALKTWAAVGELPDFFEVVGADTYETLRENGDLYELNSALDATGYYDGYNNGDIYKQAHAEEDGNRYSFGVTIGQPLVCYYNVSLFEELGLSEPTNYEEFKNCITTLKEAGKIPVALFAAEQWPGMAIYDLAVVAEGVPEGLDLIDAGEEKFADKEAYYRAAQKLQEIVELGAFGSGALSTNASQAFELEATGEAGFVFNGNWHFDTAQDEGYGENMAWCHYNVFADAENAEAVKLNAVGGTVSKQDFSVNANPTSGVDPETVARLAMEFKYYWNLAEAELGRQSLVISEFKPDGSSYYVDYCDFYGTYESFNTMPFSLKNGELASAFGNGIEMMVSGNFTADDFMEEMAASGF